MWARRSAAMVGNSHYLINKKRLGLCLVCWMQERAAAWQARTISRQQANDGKMGKDKRNRGKGDGRLAGVREQTRAGELVSRFNNGQWWHRRRAGSSVSGSVRSLTAHRAHRGRVWGIGSEYGQVKVLAAAQREKSEVGLSDVTTPPPPPDE